MKDSATKSKFVELRALGKSFASIADELQVSKRQLISWGRELEGEIANLRAVELESLYEQFFISREGRIKLLGEQLQKVRSELSKRDLGDVPTGTLLNQLLRLLDSLKAEQVELKFATPTPEDESENERLIRELGLVRLG